MSAILYLLGRHDQALQECDNAISIEKSTGQVRSLRLATYLVQKGDVLITEGGIREGIKCYENAPTIRFKRLPPNHPDLASVHNKMAAAFTLEERFEDAFKYCQQALTSQLSYIPPDHIDLSETYGILGNIAYGQSKYEEARRQQECALALIRKNPPKDHLLAANMHVSLAMTLLALREHQTAIIHTTQALNIYRVIFPLGHPEI